MKRFQAYFIEIFFFILLISNITNAQDLRWAKHSVPVREIPTCTDTKGNIYAIMHISNEYNNDIRFKSVFGIDSMVFNNITANLNSLNMNRDVLLISYDCNGYYRWHKSIGGGAQDLGLVIASDTLGGIYLSGFFHAYPLNHQIHIDTDTIIAHKLQRSFILKYDTAGVFQWFNYIDHYPAALLQNKLKSIPMDIAVTPIGDVHLFCIMLPDTFANGAYITTNAPVEKKLHVLQYNKDGNFKKGINFEFYDSDTFLVMHYYRNCFTYSPHNDRYYFTHPQKSSPAYDVTLGTTTLQFLESCLACFKPDGSLEWLRVEDSVEFFGTPTFDDTGNLYIGSGTLYNNVTWEGYFLTNTLYSSNAYRSVRFIAKFNPANQLLMVSDIMEIRYNLTEFSSVVYSNGVLGLGGKYLGHSKIKNYEVFGQPGSGDHSDIFFAKFDASTGAILSFDTLKSSLNSRDYVHSITTDHRNNFYITGLFSEKISIQGDTLTARRPPTAIDPNPQDGLLLKWGHDDCNCVAPKPDFTYSYQGAATVQYDYTGSIPYTNIEWSMGVLSPPQYGNSVSYTYSNSELQETLKICCTVTSGECGSNKICKDIDMKTLSLNGMEAIGNTLTLYPNPASATISISHNLQSAYIEVYNSTGQSVIGRRAIGTNHTIDVSGLSSGVYILKLINADGQHATRKFIVSE